MFIVLNAGHFDQNGKNAQQNSPLEWSDSSVPDILNERSEIRECLNILFFIILGCIAFAVFFVVQKFTPNSHLIAALTTLG
ncbi:hypothetical protein CEXT_520471 [Caerostris extrusa]|uniref:Uncharacterized protein n=1 Tax=Caerostris extrusa TaxID=172846 RepID=A0AAV4NP47_CAEEX|nr:hypothetical protein CEXT_520471 [Caerostris extrusa]